LGAQLYWACHAVTGSRRRFGWLPDVEVGGVVAPSWPRAETLRRPRRVPRTPHLHRASERLRHEPVKPGEPLQSRLVEGYFPAFDTRDDGIRYPDGAFYVVEPET